MQYITDKNSDYIVYIYFTQDIGTMPLQYGRDSRANYHERYYGTQQYYNYFIFKSHKISRKIM